MAVKDRLYGVPVVGTALRVQDRYVADAADQLAAAIGFFAFLSLFPLMILALGITGQVLAGRPDLRDDVIDAILSAVPGFDAATSATEVGGLVESIVDNRGALGVIGVVTLLVSGLRVVNAGMAATTKVFQLPPPTGAVKVRGRQLTALLVLGVLTLLSTSAGALVGATGVPMPGIVRAVAIPVLAAALDVLVFYVAYRMLSFGDGGLASRDLLAGAVLAAVGWTGLKVFGSTFVARQLASANAVYGPLAGVVALLLLLYLAGRLYLYGAELTAVRAGLPLSTAALGTTAQVAPGVEAPHDDADLQQGAADSAPTPQRPQPTLRIPPGSLGPGDPSPAVSDATRARLAELEARRRAGR